MRPWAEEARATHPVLLDRDHLLADLYGVTNVPTVIWIDEGRRIVRPPDVAFSSDAFIDFHEIDPEPHLEALRAWVRHGRVPFDEAEVAARRVEDSPDQLDARLHHRLAVHLLRDGRRAEAERHLEAAAALAPLDFTIRRSTLPLLGKDPFLGEEFLAFYAEFEEAGRPYYGRRTRRDA